MKTEDDVPKTNWARATAAFLASLVCRFCGACNRPGVTYIEIEPDGTQVCTVCGKSWRQPAGRDR